MRSRIGVDHDMPFQKMGRLAAPRQISCRCVAKQLRQTRLFRVCFIDGPPRMGAQHEPRFGGGFRPWAQQSPAMDETRSTEKSRTSRILASHSDRKSALVLLQAHANRRAPTGARQ
jgi:hypothetical protein